jgi:hypothetical protein
MCINVGEPSFAPAPDQLEQSHWAADDPRSSKIAPSEPLVTEWRCKLHSIMSRQIRFEWDKENNDQE